MLGRDSETLEKLRFQKTLPFRYILELREFRREQSLSLFEVFERWPILEVRQACLKCLKESGVIYLPDADWTEKCIKDLAHQYDHMAEEILSWYVFAEKHQQLEVRAIEFAISLAETCVLFDNHRISKIVCGRICDHSSRGLFYNLYPLVPSLPKFIDKLFGEIRNHPNTERREYFEHNWHCTERGLKMIMEGKDFSFLPKIDELIILLEDRKIYPSSSEPPYTKDLHLAMLKATSKILKQAQREALKNPEA